MPILNPNKLYKDLDMSFEPHPETGDVLKKIDTNSVKQSVKTLLQTNYGERLFHPEIGSPLKQLLFEPMDPVTTETLRSAVRNVLENYEPRVVIQYVDVIPKYERNEYEITIFFNVIGLQDTSLTVTLERLR